MNNEAEKLPAGYREISISGLKANIYSIILIIPILLLYSIPFIFIWNHNPFESMKLLIVGKKLVDIPISHSNQLMIIGILILSTGSILHEIIHGIVCAVYAKKGFRSFEFGIIWKALAPYAHCKEPLTAKAYRLVIIMPGLVLGVIPSAIGIAAGNGLIILFGILFTVVAGGDIIMYWLTRKLTPDTLVQDIPDKIGCYVIENSNLD